MDTRLCTRCAVDKPLSAFGTYVKNNVRGYKAVCKPCDSDIHREMYAKNSAYRLKTIDAAARRTVAREAHRVAGGLCRRCGKVPPAEGRMQCEKCLAYVCRKQIEYINAAKDECYVAYGGYVCVCCGESEKMFLTLDHIDSDGAAHRKEVFGTNERGGLRAGDMYRHLKRKGFPPGFQVLCFNCNCGRQRNKGVCPHQNQQASA